MLSPLTHPALNTPHGFFTRHGGVSCGLYNSLNVAYGSNDTRDHVTENRQRIATYFNVDSAQLALLHQVHSATCVTIKDVIPSPPPQADAYVTAQPHIIISVLTADCAPVLLHDAHAGVIGAAHAGWKGAVHGIIYNTVQAMCALGATYEHIHAVIGPCIAQTSYEVDANFKKTVLDMHPQAGQFFVPSPKHPASHYQFDLRGFVAQQLQAACITHINKLPQDTYEDGDFFSYRCSCHNNEPDFGRQCSAIMLRA